MEAFLPYVEEPMFLNLADIANLFAICHSVHIFQLCGPQNACQQNCTETGRASCKHSMFRMIPDRRSIPKLGREVRSPVNSLPRIALSAEENVLSEPWRPRRLCSTNDTETSLACSSNPKSKLCQDGVCGSYQSPPVYLCFYVSS